MKKIVQFIITVSLTLSLFNINTLAAAKEYNWYCTRNGNRQPPITKEERLILNYSAVALDRRISDESEKKVLYLTFDAGYENGNVSKILDILYSKKVPAAFFLLDNIILKNSDLVKRMFNEGHSVCNHTEKHQKICNYTKAEIGECLGKLEKICSECTGKEMTRYFRFPEGKYSESALKSLNELGYKTVFWSFAYDDWDNNRQPSPAIATKKVLDNTHNGAVILLHPTSATNVQILPTLIDEWRSRGFTFGTMDELFGKI